MSSTVTLKAIAYESGWSDSGVASATYTIVISTPAITNVTPSTGTAGTLVTITGSGFGATQGSGRVWIGSTVGIVSSWSDTQIQASVASGATSGSVQVLQGSWSGAVPFTVTSSVIITGISPASGVPGTAVTITGSGFGAAQGGGQVYLGTAPGMVQSWSDTQIVALVGSSAATGVAQVLQNGSFSTGFPFTVNVPHITGVSPASGVPSTVVTITGTGFGSAQGGGTIQLGSVAGLVNSWSDTQVVAVVASSSLSGIVRIQQSGFSSNSMGFTVPAAGGNSVTLAPNVLSMQVNDTHTIQALNASGQPVTGLTWTSSDATVVSLSSSDPPVLTALAAGHVTITGGSATTDVTVSATPFGLGTVLWSNAGDGSGVAQIIPAVPSATGVADVFAVNFDGLVQAIASDGTVAWSANVGQYANVYADFQGGLIVNNVSTIYKLDGITGQAYPGYTLPQPSGVPSYAGNGAIGVVPNTDGTVFVLTATQNISPGGTAAITGINPLTGAANFTMPINIGPSAVGYSGTLGSLMVAGDGYAYVPYSVLDTAGPIMHIFLLRVNSAGASDIMPVYDWNNGVGFADILGAPYSNLIANGSTGVFFTMGTVGPCVAGTTLSDPDNPGGPCAYSFTVTTSGTSVNLVSAPVPVNGGYSPVLQSQNGSFFVTDGTNVYNIDSSGNLLWSAPNQYPLIATADGGVVAWPSDSLDGNGQPFQGTGTIYDQNGNVTGTYSVETQAWTGNVYAGGSGLSVSEIVANPLLVGTSYWAFQNGNNSRNSAAALPLPDSIKANTDIVESGLVGSVTREIDYWPFQGTTQYDQTKPIIITERLYKVSGVWPPTGCNATGYDPNNPSETFCSSADKHFDDLITTGFVRKQQFFVKIPGLRNYQVQIYPCTAQNTFGMPVWQNLLDASNTSVIVNGDAGSTVRRVCTK